MKSGLAMIAVLLGLSAASAAPLRVVVVGDSTVCDYPTESPCRGWGQFVEGAFRTGTVSVLNLARSGRSTRSFLKEGLWSKALQAKPDFVLIQFGHNDSHGPGRPESTDAATDYRDFLRRYVDETRAAGAVPILVTPMHRRTFGKDGRLADILQPYADAMKAVAMEKKVVCIDLHAASGALFTQMGESACRGFDSAPGDRTHFNERGARAMADLVVRELPQADVRLRNALAAPVESGAKRETNQQGDRQP